MSGLLPTPVKGAAIDSWNLQALPQVSMVAKVTSAQQARDDCMCTACVLHVYRTCIAHLLTLPEAPLGPPVLLLQRLVLALSTVQRGHLCMSRMGIMKPGSQYL